MAYYRIEDMADITKRAPLGCEAMIGRNRCKADVIGTFGICAAEKGYMLVCAGHDVELNRVLLTALGVTNVNRRVASYKRYRLPRIAEGWRAAWIKTQKRQEGKHE